MLFLKVYLSLSFIRSYIFTADGQKIPNSQLILYMEDTCVFFSHKSVNTFQNQVLQVVNQGEYQNIKAIFFKENHTPSHLLCS